MNKGHNSLVRVRRIKTKVQLKAKKVQGNFSIRGKWIRNVGMTASFLLVLFAALTVRPVVLKQQVAEGAEGDSETTLAITTGKGSANLEIETTSATGTFAASGDDDMATFTVTTTNFTGYTLNISGADDNGLLTNADAATSIASIAAATDAETFANGSVDTYNNRWGYQVNLLDTTSSAYVPMNDGNYLPAPTTTDTALNATECANGSTKCPDNVDTYGIRLGARVDYERPSGDYTNTFTLVAVGNPVTYTISYDDTTKDSSVTGSPINPEVTTTGTTEKGSTAISATLATGKPTRTGYTFAGWCDGEVTHTASADSTCSGTTYAAGADYLINRTLDNTDIKLHAMWNVDKYLQTVRVRYQDATGAYGSYSTYNACTVSVAYGAKHSCTIPADTTYQKAELAEYTVTSTNTKDISVDRNTNTVTLSKGTGIDAVKVTGTGVKSGSGTASATVYYGGAVSIEATLTSGYEWVNWTGSATYTGQTQAISSVTSNLSFTANGKSSVSTMQSFTSAQCAAMTAGSTVTLTDARDNQSYLIGKLNDNHCWMLDNLRLGTTDISVNLTSSNTNLSTTINASTWNAYRKTSGFTSYTAPMFNSASANNTTTSYGSGSGKIGVYYNYCAASANTYCAASGSGSGDASYDICPSGWRMPTGGSSGEYQALYTAYSSNAANFRAALSTPLSGLFYNSSANSQGSNGYLWSSTRYSGSNMYDLNVYSSGVNPTYYGNRDLGFSVRCILK